INLNFLISSSSLIFPNLEVPFGSWIFMEKTTTQPQIILLFFLLLLMNTYSLGFNVRALQDYSPTSKKFTMQVFSKKSTTTTTTTTVTIPTRVAATRNARGKFGVAAHNVPSGPNPESNR
ncbi:hypothetical protein AABB24_039285, partial [Solanum stoloniferum]